MSLPALYLRALSPCPEHLATVTCARLHGVPRCQGFPSTDSPGAPTPRSPLTGHKCATSWEREELCHPSPMWMPSGFTSLRVFHLSLLLAVEKASSRRGTNQITSQVMKIMGNKVLLEAAWLDSYFRVSLDLNW